jgi:hypothetical protein
LSRRRQQIVRPEHRSGTAIENPELEYSEEAWAPGLRLFRCATWRARLTTTACSARWREAQVAVRERAEELAKCRGCAFGANHAGYPPVGYSDYYQAKICPRCGRGNTRIIGNRRCPSCYNRERELRIGRNGRGNAPVELMERPLVAVEVVVSVDGKLRRIRDSETSGTAETLFQILRITKGVIRFPYAPGWRPEGIGSPLIEKALEVHLEFVEGADPGDVNGGMLERAEPHARSCTPWHASLFRTTGLTVVPRPTGTLALPPVGTEKSPAWLVGRAGRRVELKEVSNDTITSRPPVSPPGWS